MIGYFSKGHVSHISTTNQCMVTHSAKILEQNLYRLDDHVSPIDRTTANHKTFQRRCCSFTSSVSMASSRTFRPFLPLLALLLLTTQAAHLPAVRAPVEKRALVSRLLRSADSHKRRSLRDVLAEHPSSPNARPTTAKDSRFETNQRDVQDERSEKADGEREVFRTVSQLFAWAIQHTAKNLSITLNSETDGSMLRPAEQPPLRELPSSLGRTFPSSRRSLRVEQPIRETTATEFDILKRSIHVLETSPPNRQVRALHVLEELCHSIDNGRDLQITGGIPPLVSALESAHAAVRANAAWALATCSQNNPAVQNASLHAGAVPRLSYLAARDRSVVVRAKALFALNAMLELEAAREAFERLPLAIHAVRNALVDGQDTRATRRALNLTELLARRNLDAWKTWLEAWDVPSLVERILRVHSDGDVRESAARTLAALDGRVVP